ncbi:MAG: hypothetical protein N4A68_11845 [Maledivibacter sp.]|jgi:hypothetical protein|nr:hypothetical protein [Maledivibacter sp.]
MKKKDQRKILGPGSSTSYKLPVIKGNESQEFYRWLNSFSSINGAITEALKLKFAIDNLMKKRKSSDALSSEVNVKIEKATQDIVDIEDIHRFDTENSAVSAMNISDVKNAIDLEMIKRTFDSVRR